MRREHLDLLRSPETGGRLVLDARAVEGDRILEGVLRDETGTEFPITRGIPRFVPVSNYCDSFTVEWEKWPDILSSYSGYGERFEKETRWGNNLSGELILEAGCGSGAFSPHALATGATVLSLDYSSGVEAAAARSKDNPRHLVVQADIFRMPIAPKSFDRAFCFGVVQHTPDPKKALKSVVDAVKPGGSVAADIYIRPPDWALLEKAKYRWRNVVKSRDPAELHRKIVAYVRWVYPIARVLEKFNWGKKINRNILFDDYKSRLPGMNTAKYAEFAALDIFDFLSPAYDIPASEEEFRQWFVEFGLKDIDVHPGYNGIEGRGRKTP